VGDVFIYAPYSVAHVKTNNLLFSSWVAVY